MAGCFVSKVILMAPESRLRDTTVSVKTVVKSLAKSTVCLATEFRGAEAEGMWWGDPWDAPRLLTECSPHGEDALREKRPYPVSCHF